MNLNHHPSRRAASAQPAPTNRLSRRRFLQAGAAAGGLMLSLSLPFATAMPKPPAPKALRQTLSSASEATGGSCLPCPMSRWARAPIPRSRC